MRKQKVLAFWSLAIVSAYMIGFGVVSRSLAQKQPDRTSRVPKYTFADTLEKQEEQLKTNPDRVIVHAVRGMLPKNRLGRAMLKKLKVYAGSQHPHAAQKPEPLAL